MLPLFAGAGAATWPAGACGGFSLLAVAFGELAFHCAGFLGCLDRWELPFGLLSQGEQVRVLIARSLMLAPRLLILDEPCTGLDPVARDAFLAMLDGFIRRQPGLTTVFVTHHMEEILPATTHVLALRHGRPVACGPKAEVLSEPVLERTFGQPFTVRREHGRLYVHPKPGAGSIWAM